MKKEWTSFNKVMKLLEKTGASARAVGETWSDYVERRKVELGDQYIRTKDAAKDMDKRNRVCSDAVPQRLSTEFSSK